MPTIPQERIEAVHQLLKALGEEDEIQDLPPREVCDAYQAWQKVPREDEDLLYMSETIQGALADSGVPAHVDSHVVRGLIRVARQAYFSGLIREDESLHGE